MVTPDHDVAVAIVVTVIPSAMQATIVSVELDTRAAVVAIAVVSPIAADIDAESAGACGRGNADGEGRQCGQRVRELPHCSSPLVATWRKRMPAGSVAGNSKKLS